MLTPSATSRRVFVRPPPGLLYSPGLRSDLTTRWQGTPGSQFAFMREPTARNAPGWPEAEATSLYVMTEPLGMLLTTARTRSRNTRVVLRMKEVYQSRCELTPPYPRGKVEPVHSKAQEGEDAMGWPKLLVLVRHAESIGNTMSVDERAGYDVSTHAYPITERGRAQAAITGTWLKETFGGFDARYVSYYTRSKETMAIMCPGEKAYEDPRLAEAQRGMYHVLTKAQLESCYPEELARKQREGLYHYRPFGGENWPDIELRIHSFLGTLSRDYDGQKVVIVVHGHWLILFQRLIHHYPIEEAVRRYHGGVVENASVTVYRGQGPRWRPWTRDRLQLVGENIVPWKGRVEDAQTSPA